MGRGRRQEQGGGGGWRLRTGGREGWEVVAGGWGGQHCLEPVTKFNNKASSVVNFVI